MMKFSILFAAIAILVLMIPTGLSLALVPYVGGACLAISCVLWVKAKLNVDEQTVNV